MGGYSGAEVTWFQFEHEPSYSLRFGPKYDFLKEFDSLNVQLESQAAEKGRFTIYLNGGWMDEKAYEQVLSFFLSHRVIFGNEEAWGPDFGMFKEHEEFCFEDAGNQEPKPVRERIDGYYRVSLLPPSALSSKKVPFENLLDIDEEEDNMQAIKASAAIIRSCRAQNKWLAFSLVDA
jgi:hypothetical protein